MKTFDLVIVGGGPAGISAAVNAASEGLKTVICDASVNGFGGQAGSSSLIENFLGFPNGISGKELTQRAIAQADKFNTQFLAPFQAMGMTKDEGGYWNIYSDDDVLISKSVLLAMGVSYKIHNAKNLVRFTGQGVSYGSPSLSETYEGKTIAIVGGANSAGQAAVYLAGCKHCNVKLIIRSGSIEDKMSAYLVNKIANLPNIEVMTNTEVLEACGKTELESLRVRINGDDRQINVDRLFILIGAKPKTGWLKGLVTLDDHGFIVTGNNMLSMEAAHGIFAAGDIRSGSVKRVASAVGEGARAVNDIHSYLSQFNFTPALAV